MIKRYLALLLLCSRALFAETDESVTVEGERNMEERSHISRTGQGLLIQPNEASRFDASSHLRQESSLTFIETGRVSPSGFVIPKIRGQDSKLTDIYLEDLLLSDPYSGLPLVEDIDLRAFGTLELYQGASPISVPSANSVGVLRYRFQHAQKSRAILGLVTGSPYGHSIWGLGIYKKQNHEFRLYARTHQSSGRYSYYSDQATPYNKADDREKSRLNNDQRSEQIMPVYRSRLGAYDLQALAWVNRADRGIPSGSAVLSSSARDMTKGLLADISLARSWDELAFFENISLQGHLGRSKDQRETLDPDRLILNAGGEAEMNIETNRQGIRGNFDVGEISTFLTIEEAQSKIEQSYQGSLALSLKRSNETAVLGLGYSPTEILSLEGKISSLRQWDKLQKVSGVVMESERAHPTRYRFSRGESLSAALGKDYGIYSQISRSRRLPSLYEEFGNGSTVRPNDKLRPEELFHRELGVFFRHDVVKASAAYYHDRTEEKIVIVPILASASKALNVAKTEITGFDSEISVGLGPSLITAKASIIKAMDLTQVKKRKLPTIPEKIILGEWRQKWLSSLSTHLSGRYRSEVYRDLGNTVRLPAVVTYDGNIDYRYKNFEIGLALRNLLDTKRVPIESSSSSGYTGISDISGSPLPGRQWILNFVSTWE